MGRRKVGTLVAGAAAAGYALRDEDRRHRLARQARIYRLTARRGGHWVAVKVKGARATEEERARLEQQFAIRSAEDVARELGNMKGAIMKAGQMLSFVAEGLPPEAQQALAALQADVPPMAPSLAEQVVRDELGADPEKLFLDWDPVPVAAASIGQVHKAVLKDGRIVAVKVQYPGVDKAIRSDLDNAELLYGMFSAMAMRNLDVKGLVDELRERMVDELDYEHEARCQTEIATIYAGHPFIRIPAVIPERSARRVLTTEWVDGLRWEEFLEGADEATRQRSAEVLFRFSQGSIHGNGVFNGDPHPGNYRFHRDGTVTFLDFGLVKRWSAGELEQLTPVLDALLSGDARATTDALVGAGFLQPDHGHDPADVYAYVSGPYVPYLSEEFTYERGWTGEALGKLIDINGEYGPIIKSLNMPTSFVILDRVVWGMSALLGRLGAHNRWRAILAEYREGTPPATELGEVEARWRDARRAAL